MPEFLFWMFKIKEFKKHFFLILLICTFFIVLGSICLFSKSIFGNFRFSEYTNIGAFAIFLIPILFILGYFWNLTDEIINRDWDVNSGSVYCGKSKIINKITLPEIQIFKCIWRGIASIFASILLSLPIILLINYNNTNSQLTQEFFNFDSQNLKIFYLIIYIFISSFIPALAWNYARRDSVIAVWNFPKAVFVMANYPIKYWFNTIMFIFVNIINGLLISKLLNLPAVMSAYSMPNLPELNLCSLIYMAILIIANIYLVYVNAFLIGTLTPAGENY